jgi:hypothetical protein
MGCCGGAAASRAIVLNEAADIDTPAVRALIALAVAGSPRPFDTAAPRRMVIKSISAKQRPRRPPEGSSPPRRRG